MDRGLLRAIVMDLEGGNEPEPRCFDCGAKLLTEKEIEEGRCFFCSDIDAVDEYLEQKHPDERI